MPAHLSRLTGTWGKSGKIQIKTKMKTFLFFTFSSNLLDIFFFYNSNCKISNDQTQWHTMFNFWSRSAILKIWRKFCTCSVSNIKYFTGLSFWGIVQNLYTCVCALFFLFPLYSPNGTLGKFSYNYFLIKKTRFCSFFFRHFVKLLLFKFQQSTAEVFASNIFFLTIINPSITNWNQMQ